MELDGRQSQRLREGLQSAFTRDDLRLLLREELDWKLSDIASDRDSNPQVFGKLIEYAEEQGALAHLVLAALRKNSGNAKFNQFVGDWIQHQRQNPSDMAEVKTLLQDPALKDRLVTTCSTRNWTGFYQRDIAYLTEDACTLVYAQVLGMQLLPEFPEIKASLLPTAQPVATLQAVGDIEQPTTAHLMMVLQEQGADNKQMRITSSLWVGENGQDASNLASNSQEQGVLCPNRMKAIAPRVKSLVDQAEEVLRQKYKFAGEIAIHFFVEVKHLNTEWDQLGMDTRKIGTAYPVMVRALDRYQKARYHRRLRQSWQRACQNPDEAFALCCLDCHEDVPRDALGIHWRGQFRGKRDSQKAFERVLERGVPMSIWLRYQSTDVLEDTMIAQAVQALLTARALHAPDGWVRNVLHTRENCPILGKHLAIWWDHPELCPELPGFGEALAGEQA